MLCPAGQPAPQLQPSGIGFSARHRPPCPPSGQRRQRRRRPYRLRATAAPPSSTDTSALLPACPQSYFATQQPSAHSSKPCQQPSSTAAQRMPPSPPRSWSAAWPSRRFSPTPTRTCASCPPPATRVSCHSKVAVLGADNPVPGSQQVVCPQGSQQPIPTDCWRACWLTAGCLRAQRSPIPRPPLQPHWASSHSRSAAPCTWCVPVRCACGLCLRAVHAHVREYACAHVRCATASRVAGFAGGMQAHWARLFNMHRCSSAAIPAPASRLRLQPALHASILHGRPANTCSLLLLAPPALHLATLHACRRNKASPQFPLKAFTCSSLLSHLPCTVVPDGLDPQGGRAHHLRLLLHICGHRECCPMLQLTDHIVRYDSHRM